MSTEAWKLEKDLCRCCHAEGSFHNLAEPRYNFGQEEIYAEMLRHSLNIDLSPVTGMLCAMTFTICEGCIQRLRDAASFKRQVLLCEDRFKDMYGNVLKALNPSLNPTFEVKVEELPNAVQGGIKEELALSDDDGFDMALDDDDDDDDDDEDDDKTVLQFKLDNAKKAKAKAKAKPKTTTKKLPAKKIGRPKKGEQSETASKTEDKPKKGDKCIANYYTVVHNQYRCNSCDKSFASQPLVYQHFRVVHLKRRPRNRKCPKCEAMIPAYLRAHHMEQIHGVPAPTCGVCQKKFRYPCLLVQHQRKVHMGERTIVCSICEKSFFDDLSLRVHMTAHSDEKRFKCNYCNRQFRWQNNLKDHVKLHTDDKRFECGDCGKAFIQKSGLKLHVSKNHSAIDDL